MNTLSGVCTAWRCCVRSRALRQRVTEPSKRQHSSNQTFCSAYSLRPADEGASFVGNLFSDITQPPSGAPQQGQRPPQPQQQQQQQYNPGMAHSNSMRPIVCGSYCSSQLRVCATFLIGQYFVMAPPKYKPSATHNTNLPPGAYGGGRASPQPPPPQRSPGQPRQASTPPPGQSGTWHSPSTSDEQRRRYILAHGPVLLGGSRLRSHVGKAVWTVVQCVALPVRAVVLQLSRVIGNNGSTFRFVFSTGCRSSVSRKTASKDSRWCTFPSVSVSEWISKGVR